MLQGGGGVHLMRRLLGTTAIMLPRIAATSSQCSREALLRPALQEACRSFFWKKSSKKEEEEAAAGDSSNIPDHLKDYVSSQKQIDDLFVESSLDLLRLTSELDLTEKEYDTLTEVTTMLFGTSAQSGTSLGEQFDTLFVALSLPAARSHSELSRVLLIVVDSVMPTPVAELMREAEDVICTITDEDARTLFSDFVHAMVGESVPADPCHPKFQIQGADELSGIAILLKQVVVAVPELKNMMSFRVFEKDAETIALRARLFALITQLCKAFDTDGTGMIPVTDLEDSLRNVLQSEEEVEEVLAGVEMDESGRIRYHQLCLMLTKPRKPK